jgi:hypothetical protein
MKEPNDDVPNRLDSLTKKLYSRNTKVTGPRQGVLHSDRFTVEELWKSAPDEPEKEDSDLPPTRNFFKTFFIVAVSFFLIALGFVGWTFFKGNNQVSSDNISINVLGNSFTPGGEELPLEVEIANQNAVPLELADLIIEYPKTGADIGAPSDLVKSRLSVGTVAPGKVARQKLSLMLVGEEGSMKQIKLTLEYRVSGSTVSFRKERIFPVKISSAPLVLTLEAPTTTASGQAYKAKITVAANTTKTVPNMILKVDYPVGFEFKDANPKPTLFQNTWSLGSIEPGKPKVVEVSGIMSAEDGEDRTIRAYVGEPAKDNPQAIGAVYASKLVTAQIDRPAVDARLLINGSAAKEIVTQAKSTVQGQVVWTNNLSTSVSDMEIVLKLGGQLIDQGTVQAFGGYYNSSENTITWNKNTNRELSVVDPVKTGTFGFSFATKGLYSQGTVVNSAPEVGLDVSITAKVPIDGGGLQQTTSSDTKKIRFSTDFQVSGAASYYNGPFTNTGSLPPRANQKTTYTIKWTLTNTANLVSGTEVRAALPINVKYLGTFSPANSDVTQDSRTGEIVWKAGDVARGAGYGATPKTLYFQVELLPSVSDIGTSPVLVQEIKAKGTDSATTAKLEAKWNPLTTKLYNDQNYSPTNEKVVQ